MSNIRSYARSLLQEVVNVVAIVIALRALRLYRNLPSTSFSKTGPGTSSFCNTEGAQYIGHTKLQHGSHMSDSITCVIGGGGPAGMIAGLLLARAGVEVTVFEKHGDFLRDFRGDTVHPTTLELLDELGLIEQFNAMPHTKIRGLTVHSEHKQPVRFVDIAGLSGKYPYVAIAPQWDFLKLLADAGAKEPTFRLVMQAEVTDLIYQHQKVVGVQYIEADVRHELRADLTIAADGRWSMLRTQAHLPMISYNVPIDLWWFRLETSEPVGEAILPISSNQKLFIVIPRTGYAQIANIIPKGSDGRLRAEGLQQLRAAVSQAVPATIRSAKELTWDEVKLLDIRLNRLTRWYRDGLLCIGDAAHAMSPVGGVGVNLAVQDGVAAARILAKPLLAGGLSTEDLAAVQLRREPAAIFIQRLQRLLHRIIGPRVTRRKELEVPGPMRFALEKFPILGKIPAKLLFSGRRPEHAPVSARRGPSSDVE